MRITQSRAIVAATAAALALGTFSIQSAAAASPQKPQVTKRADELGARQRYRHRGNAAALAGVAAVFGAIAGLAAADAYGYYGYPAYPSYGPYPYYGYGPRYRVAPHGPPLYRGW